MKKVYLLLVGALFLASTAWAQPVNAPTSPIARNAADVISIYSEAYDNIAGVNLAPFWGQPIPVNVSAESIGNNEIIKMTPLSYQGIDFGNQNVSGMETVHIDVWSLDCTELDFYLIANGGGEKPKRLTIAAGWNSFDIPLAYYSEAPGLALPLDKIWQFKFVAIAPANGSTVYYDNIYFYKSAATPNITGFTIPQKVTTDVAFDIIDPTSNSNGAFTYTSSNTSVATISGKTINILGAGTTIITANQAAAGGFNAGSATTSFVVNFPPPTTAPITPPARDEGDVISVYSEAYPNVSGINFNTGWGATQISEQSYATNHVQRMLNFSFQGIELNSDVDVSGMEKLHMDIWTPDCSSFEISLIYKLLAGGQDERKVKLTPTLNGWNSYTILLSEYTVQDAGVNLTQIFQIKFEATGWTPTTTKTVYYDNLYFFKSGTLPVSLSDFNAKNNANEVALTWKTLSESNNKGFAIERSQNGKDWQELGFVNGKNNSTSLVNYTFEDKNPSQGINYYRLVQEDNNGSQTISDIKSVNFSVSNLEKLKAYPNPATENLFAQLGQVNHNNSTLSLIDLKGNIVKSVGVNQLNSNSTIQLSVESLPKGLYLLILNDGSDIISNKIIIK